MCVWVNQICQKHTLLVVFSVLLHRLAWCRYKIEDMGMLLLQDAAELITGAESKALSKIQSQKLKTKKDVVISRAYEDIKILRTGMMTSLCRSLSGKELRDFVMKLNCLEKRLLISKSLSRFTIFALISFRWFIISISLLIMQRYSLAHCMIIMLLPDSYKEFMNLRFSYIYLFRQSSDSIIKVC